PSSLKAAEKHSQAYIKVQHQKAFSERLTSIERGAFNELLAFKKQALDCGRFAAALKNEEALIKKGDSPLKTALEEASKERDFLAFKIVKFYEKYGPLLERADVLQEQLLKHAVFGEVRQLALKHSLAKTIEKRLEFADQLRGMVGEGDKLDKPLYGILKSIGIDFSRLKFEQGCLELMKRGESLPFKTVEELSSAFVSLNEYRVAHQEAAKEWHIIKTHAVQKVTTLQDDQIVSLNEWTKNSSHESKEKINPEDKLFSREALEKTGKQESTKKHKRKKEPQNLQEKDNISFKEAANTQTLSLVTRELAKVVNGYSSLSSENLPSTSLPQDIQARNVELIHLQSHLRKGHSGYLGIFKMDHTKDKTWENLREKKLSLAGPILENYGEIIKVSFGHDYGRMQKEAYEHQMGQLVSHYQEVRGGGKTLLAANLLSHLEQEGYQGICTKTQLKTRDVNFEALHLYGLFHESSSHLQEKSVTLPVLEKYIQAQEAFSSLWKPRCEVIEKALGPVKEDFAIHREKTLSLLEDKKPNRSCVFALDKLVNETHALISKGKLEKKQDNPGQIPHAPEQNLQTKVQEKLQHLGMSLGVSFSQEHLESLSHEVISLSHRKEQIHGQRLALMKRTKFENDAEFFDGARNRNEAASHLMETPLGKVIEDSKHIFLVKDYAERYRSKLEKARSSSGSSHQIDQKFIFQNTRPFIEAEVVKAVLIENMASFADDVLSSLGEKHNQAASTAVERRYGNNGKIAVNLRTGAWLDWRDTSIAGGPFEMLTKLKGFSFKEAVEYGASWAGIIPERGDLKSLKRLPQKYSSQESEQKKLQKEAEESKVKIERAKTLWEKGQPIQGTLAERYLKEHRKIEEVPPEDLRFLPRFRDPTSGKSYSGLMAAARSPTGEVTAVQITCLDPQTGAKADLSVAKRSFGVLKGSAVTLQEEKSSNVLFVAEGVETALSLKEAGLKGTIKATLGLSNIKCLNPENLLNGNPNTQIIVCADHDTPDSPATRSLQKAVLDLQSKGFSVTVVKPDKLNEDFNDVLKAKGAEGVREILKRNLPKEIAKDFLTSVPSLPSKGPPKS
ncbi:MAG: toprim domain-containing protein, partial [Alphaproteobacteria bacterium]|nr:toprim domain-containing protein [Alphaproteobacteria bacterium]